MDLSWPFGVPALPFGLLRVTLGAYLQLGVVERMDDIQGLDVSRLGHDFRC